MVIPFVAHAANAPPVVRIDSACPHTFRIARLTGLARWFRSVGYTVPIRSNDPDFDAQWSVESNDREFAQALVSEREARAAIAQLQQLGCGPIGHDRRRLVVLLGRPRKPRQAREQHTLDVRAQLVLLDGVIARLRRSRSFPQHGGRTRLAVTSALLGAALVAGLVGLALGAGELIPGQLGPLVLESLIVSGPLLLLLVVVAARLLAGRSTSHKELGIVVLLLTFAVPALGVAAAVLVNRGFDDATPIVRRVPVLELREHRGDDQQVTHYAVVPDWHDDGRSRLSLRVGGAMARQIVAGRSRLRLVTSPGQLNAERLLDLQLETEPAVR